MSEEVSKGLEKTKRAIAELEALPRPRSAKDEGSLEYRRAHLSYWQERAVQEL